MKTLVIFCGLIMAVLAFLSAISNRDGFNTFWCTSLILLTLAYVIHLLDKK